MNIIERLKNNTAAFGLMDEELRAAAEEIGAVKFLRFFGLNFLQNTQCFAPAETYRLSDDYVCQHPHKSVDTGINVIECLWCGAVIEPEKSKMRWVEYPVSGFGKYWAFHFQDVRHRVDAASGMVGFGGIKWVRPCSCEGTPDISGWFVTHLPEPCEEHGPYKPVAARFWQEVKK